MNVKKREPVATGSNESFLVRHVHPFISSPLTIDGLKHFKHVAIDHSTRRLLLRTS